MAAGPVYVCKGLIKRRRAGDSGFELRVPSLQVRPGEILVLRGPSGCGKSTLLDLLALALRPDAAEELRLQPVAGEVADLGALWRRNGLDELGRLRARHIGYVLQTGGLLPFLTAGENIALPCRLVGRRSGDATTALAERLGILEHLHKYPGQLSVGERQRVAIARALVHRPSILLADEPTASVDPVNAAAILGLLVELVRTSGAVAILASHDWQPEAVPEVQVAAHRIERIGDTTRSLFWSGDP